jgi:V/A-type H+/Na+-transporting ATPase subunit D
MARLNIPPTKTGLLEAKDQLGMAEEGYELLQQKREILVMELMRLVEEVKLLETEMEKVGDRAYSSLKRMLVHIGRERAWQIGQGVRFNYAVQEKHMKIAGIPLPSLEVHSPDFNLRYSFLNTYASCDRTMVDFYEYLKLIARLASIRTMVWRLAREVKKTQRRVNALEKMVIPDTRETLVFIQGLLEEREREMLFVQKTLKNRLEVRNEDAH